MSDKKHIDRIFQESFKDFEVSPSNVVWKNIEAELKQKKKKRRAIPIWWRYAGVAALLLLLLTISFNYFKNDSNPQTNNIVDTENNVINSSKKQDEKSNSFDKLKIINDEAITENNTSKNNLNVVVDPISNINSKENIIQKKSKNSNELNNKIDASKEVLIAETPISQNSNESRTNNSLSSGKKSNPTNSILKTQNKTTIALNSKKEINNVKTIQKKDDKSLLDKNKAEIALINGTEKNTAIAHNKTSKEKEKLESLAENKLEENKINIEDAIDETTKDVSEEEKLNRWSIAPNAAPVYFSTLGEGSSIDPQFNSNSKTGNLNMSYGISASYAVNKKLTIRSGVNRVSLGYNTNNVVVFQSVGVSSSSALRNVDVSSNNGLAADALSNGSTENVSIISGENFNLNNGPESFSTNTSINQSLGYIEVPLEIQYKLLNKKFGINVIGGFSSFFLSDNKIYSEAEGGGRVFLGEATNINEVSYSANLGLGLNYRISKKIDLNFEPMFKYQINTFNDTSGDFQPFFIGVYSGFAIKF